MGGTGNTVERQNGTPLVTLPAGNIKMVFFSMYVLFW